MTYKVSVITCVNVFQTENMMTKKVDSNKKIGGRGVDTYLH